MGNGLPNFIGVVNVKRLLGKTFKSVTRNGDIISFDGEYKLLHIQDCCEDVYISDICGDLADLEGAVIIESSEEYNEDPEAEESGTWSFYKIGTAKGFVTIRFNGSSNGYYSEEASLIDKSDWGF